MAAAEEDDNFIVKGSQVVKNVSIACSHMFILFNELSDNCPSDEDILVKHPLDKDDALNTLFAINKNSQKPIRFVPLPLPENVSPTGTLDPSYEVWPPEINPDTSSCPPRQIGQRISAAANFFKNNDIDNLPEDHYMFMGGFWWRKKGNTLFIDSSTLYPILETNNSDLGTSKFPDKKEGRKLYKYGNYDVVGFPEYAFCLFTTIINSAPFTVDASDQYQTFLFKKGTVGGDNYIDTGYTVGEFSIKCFPFTRHDSDDTYFPVFHASMESLEIQAAMKEQIQSIFKSTGRPELEDPNGDGGGGGALDMNQGGTRRRKKKRRKATKKQQKGKRKRTKKQQKRKRKKTRR